MLPARTRAAQQAQPAAAPAPRPSNVARLRENCAGRVQAVAHLQYATFKKEESARYRLLWYLTDAQENVAEDDDRQYTVVPFLTCGRHCYWLGVTIGFDQPTGSRDLYLACATAIVFEGTGFDDRKTALFRAEWACESHTDSCHAQPHWHVYPAPDHRPFTPPLGPQVQRAPQTFQPDAATPARPATAPLTAAPDEHFHFAMACRWHTDGLPCHTTHILDDGAFLRWLEGCLTYTRDQLIRLASRAHRSPRA